MINLHTLLTLRQCEYHNPQAREASAAQITRTSDEVRQVITTMALEQSARAVSTATVKFLGYQIRDWTSAQLEGERCRIKQHELRNKSKQVALQPPSDGRKGQSGAPSERAARLQGSVSRSRSRDNLLPGSRKKEHRARTANQARPQSESANHSSKRYLR